MIDEEEGEEYRRLGDMSSCRVLKLDCGQKGLMMLFIWNREGYHNNPLPILTTRPCTISHRIS